MHRKSRGAGTTENIILLSQSHYTVIILLLIAISMSFPQPDVFLLPVRL